MIRLMQLEMVFRNLLLLFPLYDFRFIDRELWYPTVKARIISRIKKYLLRRDCSIPHRYAIK